jgi:hypothetical protein
MQRYTMYSFLWNALYVSGGSFTYHQELKTVYTASATCQTLLLHVAVMEEFQLFQQKTGRKKILQWIPDFPDFNLLFIFSWMELWFLTVFPKYLICSTFSKTLVLSLCCDFVLYKWFYYMFKILWKSGSKSPFLSFTNSSSFRQQTNPY